MNRRQPLDGSRLRQDGGRTLPARRRAGRAKSRRDENKSWIRGCPAFGKLVGALAVTALFAAEARADSAPWIEGVPPVALAEKFALSRARHATVEPCPGLAAKVYVVTGEKRNAPFAAVIVDGEEGVTYMSLAGEFALGSARRAAVTVDYSRVPAQEVTLELRRISETTLGYEWSEPSRIGTMSLAEPFPRLEAKRLEGGRWESSALRGRVTVINWWSTWCVPCVEEIPTLNALAEELGEEREIAFVAISPEPSREIARFLRDRTFVFEQLSSSGGTRILGDHFPRHVVVGVDGVVVFDRIGWTREIGALLRDAIRALREPASSGVPQGHPHAGRPWVSAGVRMHLR